MKRRPVQLREETWKALKRLSQESGESIASILDRLVKQALGERDEGEQERKEYRCAWCGRPVPHGGLCDACYYSPTPIRPLRVASLFLGRGLREKLENGKELSLEEFAEWFDKRRALEEYNLTEEEWQVWQEWLAWQERFKNGETSIEDREWREFVERAEKIRLKRA